MRIVSLCILAVLGFSDFGYLLGPAVKVDLKLISFVRAQPTVLTKSQSDALSAYNKAIQDFKSILSERRAQINSNQQLPDTPGQALYLCLLYTSPSPRDS